MKTKNNLKLEIGLIFLGLIIFSIGNILNQLSNISINSFVEFIDSIDWTYPLLYLIFSVILSIYRIVKLKK